MTWIHGPGWKPAIVRVLLHITVFVAVAPIIEGSICALFAGVWGLVHGITVGYSELIMRFIWFTIFGYTLSPSAAFTGLFVAIASSRILSSRWLFILASAVASLSSMANFVIAAGSLGFFSKDFIFSRDFKSLILFMVGTVTAAVICTALTKPLRRNIQALNRA